MTDGVAPRRTVYLPEPVYFEDTDGFPSSEAGRFTARFLARWAEDYHAAPVRVRWPARAGPLPSELAARERLIDELFAWMEVPIDVDGVVCWPGVGLVLTDRDGQLLDQHDGVPGTLHLRPELFTTLQAFWPSVGLPRDLYFPFEAERAVIEPVKRFGGVVLGKALYSPLRWARRESGAYQPLPLPTEGERRVALLVACGDFMGRLARRHAELVEPGRESDHEELQMVEALQRDVSELMKQTLLRQRREGAEQGQDNAGHASAS